MTKVTLKDLLDSGAHFGHQTVRWNPKMKPYIYAAREGVHIFDLAKTKEGLESAAAFAKETASQGGKILFLGTKKQAKEIIEKEAREVGMPYVTLRWLGGTITNFEQIKKSIDKLREMKDKKAKGEYKNYTKKEQLLIDRGIAKFERFLGGLSDLDKLPEAIFIIDLKREQAAALEAKKRGVYVIGMVDTNGNPDLVDYVIPINDDAIKSIELVVTMIKEAIEAGKKEISTKARLATGGKKEEQN